MKWNTRSTVSGHDLGTWGGNTPEQAHDAMARRCECGEITGVACEGDPECVLEIMPEEYRASHAAARNVGRYPCNGALRLAVSRECADSLIEEHGAEWAGIVAGSER